MAQDIQGFQSECWLLNTVYIIDTLYILRSAYQDDILLPSLSLFKELFNHHCDCLTVFCLGRRDRNNPEF